jgi:hypothetical protein
MLHAGCGRLSGPAAAPGANGARLPGAASTGAVHGVSRSRVEGPHPGAGQHLLTNSAGPRAALRSGSSITAAATRHSAAGGPSSVSIPAGIAGTGVWQGAIQRMGQASQGQLQLLTP